MGKVIGFFDEHVSRKNQRHDRLCGVFVSLLPIIIFTLAFTLILGAVRIYGGEYGLLIWAILCALLFSTLFAIKSLGTHTLPIMKDLQNHDLEAARKKAAMVVSRDVNKLDEAHVISCASETVAENLVLQQDFPCPLSCWPRHCSATTGGAPGEWLNVITSRPPAPTKAGRWRLSRVR